MSVEGFKELWDPDGVYVNTASYGLPPRAAWEAMQVALEDWRGGRTSWEAWGDATDAAREVFARLVGVPGARVAVGATVSQLVATAATGLPERARVVVPEVEFTSTLFPLLVKDFDVRMVPVDRLAEEVADGADGVAFSAVQMSNGEVADLDAILEAAASSGAWTICDATQAAGWLPLERFEFDALVCHAYKWLVSPRGSALLEVSDRLLEPAIPQNATWFAGEDVHASYFGPPLRLARSARRFDLSPAWYPWVATLPALEAIERIGVTSIHEHDLALANRFRAGLGMEPGGSAIVSAESPGALEKLERAGIVAAERNGRLRTSWHVYNDAADVDRVLDVLVG